ncbi:hypothetical protein [Rhodococcus daqingensis]|uniref:Peptidase M50 n=1 Tax=Rhodococcus daqingensis TaxID=2479363 RepID=A0ABW2RRC7_9NOCA
MTSLVLACGDAPIPPRLAELTTVTAPAVPTKPDFDELLPLLDELGGSPSAPRLVVVGEDAALAAALTRLMRTERLSVELAYVTATRTPATRLYRLPTGSPAADLAVLGRAAPLPLVRDDSGTALVGLATITGPEGGELVGETYADSTRLFSGTIRSLRVSPTLEAPGVRAAAARGWGFLGPRWTPARAVQTGSVAAVVTRDGVTTPRSLKRCSFYRHPQDWLLVR